MNATRIGTLFAWLLLVIVSTGDTLPLAEHVDQKPNSVTDGELSVLNATTSAPVQIVQVGPILTRRSWSKEASDKNGATFAVGAHSSVRNDTNVPRVLPWPTGATSSAAAGPLNEAAGRESRNLASEGGHNAAHVFQMQVTSAPFRVGLQNRAHRFQGNQRTDNAPTGSDHGAPLRTGSTQNGTLRLNQTSTSQQVGKALEPGEQRVLELLPQLLAQMKHKMGQEHRGQYADWLASLTRNLTTGSQQLRNSETTESKHMSDADDSKTGGKADNAGTPAHVEDSGQKTNGVAVDAGTEAPVEDASQDSRRPTEDRICIILHSMGDDDRLKLMEQLTRMTYPVSTAPNVPGPKRLMEQVQHKGHNSRGVPELGSNSSAGQSSELGKARSQLGKSFKTFLATQQQSLGPTLGNSSGTAQNPPQEDPAQGEEQLDIFSEQIQEQWEEFVGKLKQVARETWDHVARQMARSLEKLAA